LRLQKGVVRWNDISFYQARKFWPPAKGKDLIDANCSTCHLFQTRMASVTRDADGWRDRVEYMRTAMHFNTWNLTDQDADDISIVSDQIVRPRFRAAEISRGHARIQRYGAPFSSDALNIVYVEYDMPGPSRMPFSAAPDKDGYLWIPDFGVANKITRLDPKTGEMQDFSVPNVGTAAIHSAVPAPDGSVWLTEQASNKIGRWDPNTRQ
jgi:streptogramin lyase